MSRRDMIGAAILGGLMLALIVVLMWARPWNTAPANRPEDNPFIKFHLQKIENRNNQ